MLVGRFLQYEVAVDEQLVVGDVLCLAYLVYGLTVDTLETTVTHVDIVDGICQLLILIADNHHTVFRLLTGDILHGDITHDGVETATAYLLGFIVGIDLEHRLATLSDGDITHIDILDDPPTTGIGLDTQHTVEVG